jgi:hypothetical protein
MSLQRSSNRLGRLLAASLAVAALAAPPSAAIGAGALIVLVSLGGFGYSTRDRVQVAR